MARYAPNHMKSRVAKRSIKIGGHRSSVSLEEGFWNALKEIAFAQRTPVQCIVSRVASEGTFRNLSSAIRVFVLHYYIDQKVTSQTPVAAFHKHREDDRRSDR
jgi:predicted DNA-binding ribbon-helix-helix protein